MITSNHIHLLVVDDGDRDVIPNSMKLVARRIGQEYNQRKNRKGAYGEDRYHAIAVGNKPFAEKVKAVLGFRGKGRRGTRSGEGYQVRETPAGYNTLLRAEKEDIGPENTCSWNLNL